MKTMIIKIQELKVEISDFNKQVMENSKQMKKLNFEINHAKSLTAKVNSIINDLTQRYESLRSELKIVHDCYQRLPERSMQEHIQRQISKRKEKQKLESQLGRLKLRGRITRIKLIRNDSTSLYKNVIFFQIVKNIICKNFKFICLQKKTLIFKFARKRQTIGTIEGKGIDKFARIGKIVLLIGFLKI